MQTDIINGNIYNYSSLEKALKSAGRITNKETGVTVSLSLADKELYSEMRDRFHYFVTERKGQYYDNREDLAKALVSNVKTITQSTKRLVEIGLLRIVKTGRSNRWEIIYLTPDLFLLERDLNLTTDKTDPVWVDCLLNPVFGKNNQQSIEPVQAVPVSEPSQGQQNDDLDLTVADTPAPKQTAVAAIAAVFEEDKPAPKQEEKKEAPKAKAIANRRTTVPFNEAILLDESGKLREHSLQVVDGVLSPFQMDLVEYLILNRGKTHPEVTALYHAQLQQEQDLALAVERANKQSEIS